jgi:hypothetical protein
MPKGPENKMKFDAEQIRAATDYLRQALLLMDRGASEDVIRSNFTSYIYRVFPDRPRWAQRHVEGSEAQARFSRGGAVHRGFVDNLVDSTAIEYEANLTIQSNFDTGYGQVQDYCAGLLNDKRQPSMVIGVLSDTVRWRAYRITSVTRPASGLLGREHIKLDEIDQVNGSLADETAAKSILDFLIRYLARLGARPLTAISIQADLGFDSAFCSAHIEPLRLLVERAFDTNPIYGNIIENLWKRFVSFVGTSGSAGTFERAGYADELYILTLAKLICANALDGRVLVGDRSHIESIVRGDFFKARGLNNLVEYDYFGWLHKPPFIEAIADVAAKMQDDLRAYDFASTPSDDLFGQLMAQLAKRTQRLLLGQEWTPRWLARELVRSVIHTLPENEMPRLVDMCCGSGAMVVEAVLQAKTRIAAVIPDNDRERRVQELALAITGFDIDPLATILSKIGWVLAARDWLEPLGVFSVTIPIYNADSLFAVTPLSSRLEEEEGQETHRLQIADATLELPHFLISPLFQGAFDAIIDEAYELGMSGGSSSIHLSDAILEKATRLALAASSQIANEGDVQRAKEFLRAFSETVDRLSREGRNGIWAFILRNSYRPGLVAGQFNGLVSNPPWLALSRIADNPYKLVLRHKAEQFAIKPPGPSFLHIEMATIFLLHAVDRYLHAGARIACIVPDSVRTGYNHNPFRSAAYVRALKPVNFSVEEVWRISEATFKNRGVVLIGSKDYPEAMFSDTLPGFYADETGMTQLTICRNVRGSRIAWSEQASPAGDAGFFTPANFRQGADIMPRMLFFYELAAAPPSRGRPQLHVSPIDHRTSQLAFVVKDSKKLKNFRLEPCVLSEDLFFNTLTSNLLTPFALASPVRALLPIRKAEAGWESFNEADIAAMGPSVVSTFRQICAALGPTARIADIWNLINTRNKLVQQHIADDGYLVFTGTSGELVCSAFAESSSLGSGRLVIDQTLNWAQVDTLEEAIYLTGLFNSEAINNVIRDFQPEGAFGKRHIHSLPFGVTPPFDASQALHQDVVACTRKLIEEYQEAKKVDRALTVALNPNDGPLAKRRLVISRKIRQLLAFPEYADICRALYGV